MAKVAAAAAALVLLSGCMLGPDYKRPELAVPDQFRATPPRAELSPSAADTAWWQQFGDTQLNALVDEALANNLDVVAAAARVDQFYGVLGTTRAALFPQVGADVNGSRQRASTMTATGAPGVNPYNSAQAAVNRSKIQARSAGPARRVRAKSRRSGTASARDGPSGPKVTRNSRPRSLRSRSSTT